MHHIFVRLQEKGFKVPVRDEFETEEMPAGAGGDGNSRTSGVKAPSTGKDVYRYLFFSVKYVIFLI
jgi:hypothetical protein